MARLLLEAVNDVLTRLGEVDSHGELTTLTDSPRQMKIDRVVKAWQDAITQLYSLTAVPMPNQVVESTVTLVDGQRKYPVPAGLIKLFWPLRYDTSGYRIWPFDATAEDGGYQQLIAADLEPQNRTGRPERAAFTPTRRELYMDRTPDAAAAGLTYTLSYSKHFTFGAATDTFPFPDACVDALAPAVAHLYRGEVQMARDDAVLSAFLSQAARHMNPNPMRTRWK